MRYLNCPDFLEPFLFVFTNNVPDLFYYSHLVSMGMAVLVGMLVFLKSKSLAGDMLCYMLVMFFVWACLNLIVWTNTLSQIIIFAWSLFGIFFVLTCYFCLYFVYTYLYNKDIPRILKYLLGILFLPVLFFAPTAINVEIFDLQTCGVVGFHPFYGNYYYTLGFVVALLMLHFLISKYRNAQKKEKIEILVLGIGAEFFLASFFITGLATELFPDAYELEFYGLFGMTFFIAIIGYLIVKYKAFNIKILETQALVVALLVLIGSMFTFVDTTVQRVLVGVTLGFASITGWYLIQAIKREIKQKEELTHLTEQLRKTNQKLHEADLAKTEFMSIASHQLRTPLTAIKGYCVLMEDGSYGPVTEKMVLILKKIMYSSDRLTNLVENLLSVTRLEAGRMTYTFAPEQMETVLSELFDTFHFAALNKKISISLKLPEKPLPLISMDKQKIQEVISNLIDNAIKYTPQGSVEVILDQNPITSKSRLTVKDSGIGIPASEIPFLFAKFSRGNDTDRLHVSGTGLGLYVAKNIVEAHHGTIRIESEGEGKGTSFIVEV